MIIYLSRHGDASSAASGQHSSLSPRGLSDVARMAEFLIAKKDFKINGIWHSPKTRAAQTAKIYWKALGNPSIPLEEKKELSPDGDTREIHDQLLRQKTGNLLLVSHLPFLPDLAAILLAESGGVSSLTFPTSGIAAIEFEKTFRFLWALDPASLE